MIDVIGVSFEENSKIYYFSPDFIETNKGDLVIVETENGFQFGKVVTEPHQINLEKANKIIKKVIRKASTKDVEIFENNTKLAKEAIKKCQQIVEENKLKMNIISASYTFDKSQLLFNFVADERIDFRKLVKELASVYKTRIELRQIGVRDKAKEVGGIGICGRCLCCSSFLKSFDTLSINMAKNQNMALTPNKINGSCGRLMCCLGYENDIYEEYRKGLPSIGERIKDKEETKRVIAVDILSRSYKIINDKNEIEEIKLK